MTKRVSSAHWKPHDCAILGIDTAAISGYAYRVRGRLIVSGEVDTLAPGEVAYVVSDAIARAHYDGLKLVWVFEKSFGGPRFVTDGLARARERWDAALRERQVSRRYVHAVQPNTWRSGYFGPKWVRAPRDEIRQHEMMTARAEVGRVIELGADEAAAICISHWASRADSVAALLGRPTLSDM